MTKSTVFISYSHKDIKEKDALLSHLNVLPDIDVWSEKAIGSGETWKKAIDHVLDQAKVAILLITADYLSTPFIRNDQIPKLLQQQQKKGLIIIPLIARACAWRTILWLEEIQARPGHGEPVWRKGGIHVDEELAIVAEEVYEIIKSTGIALIQECGSVPQIPTFSLPAGVPKATLTMHFRGQEKHYRLQKLTTRLGRARDCELEIPEVCDNVEYLHGAILYQEGSFIITDGNKGNPSRFGTFVNGIRVSFSNPVQLKTKDQIVLGGFRRLDIGELARGACEIIFEQVMEL